MNILITGGASGLGATLTESLASYYPEATIYFTYMFAAENAAKIQERFLNTRSLPLDFSNPRSVQITADKLVELDIDILINNALAFFVKRHFHKVDTRLFATSFEENISPVLHITSSFIKLARKKKSGKVITILSSYVGGMPRIGLSEYTANKIYLLSMVKSWAAENVQFNIQSNAVSPEFMDTALNEGLDPRLKEEMIKQHPLKKLLTPADVADTVRFLTEAPSHLNGQNIFLDTGKN